MSAHALRVVGRRARRRSGADRAYDSVRRTAAFVTRIGVLAGIGFKSVRYRTDTEGMDPDPTTARLRAGRLSRLRAGRSRARTTQGADAPSPVPEAAVSDGAAPTGLADLTRVVATLTRHGHEVRVTDRTVPGEVPAATSRRGRLVLDDLVAGLVRRAGSEQRVSIRVRAEDEQLLLVVQTLPAGERPKPIVLEARDEDLVRRRVEAAGGRTTVRSTHGGNWIAIVRLPLRA